MSLDKRPVIYSQGPSSTCGLMDQCSPRCLPQTTSHPPGVSQGREAKTHGLTSHTSGFSPPLTSRTRTFFSKTAGLPLTFVAVVIDQDDLLEQVCRRVVDRAVDGP